MRGTETFVWHFKTLLAVTAYKVRVRAAHVFKALQQTPLSLLDFPVYANSSSGFHATAD